MKYLITIISSMLLGCSNSNKIVEHQGKAKLIYHSGNFSGMDYITIGKKLGTKMQYRISIQGTTLYPSGKANGSSLSMSVYDINGKYSGTKLFIKDSTKLSARNKVTVYQASVNDIVKLSDEEYEIIKTSFMKYTVLAAKYSLNADSLKKYLGWLEVKNSNPPQAQE